MLCRTTNTCPSESGLKLLRAKDLDDAAKQAVAGVFCFFISWPFLLVLSVALTCVEFTQFPSNQELSTANKFLTASDRCRQRGVCLQ